MEDDDYLAEFPGDRKIKGRAGSKSPKTSKTPTIPASTRKRRTKGSKSLKAIAATKRHGEGVGELPPDAVEPQETQVAVPGKARPKKRRSTSPEAPGASDRPDASTAVSSQRQEASPLRSFGSPTEAVAEVAKLGEDLKVIRAQYREALYLVLAQLYALARYFREDGDRWDLFCSDRYWDDAPVKPRRDKLDNILSLVIRRALVGPRKQVNDRVHKYTQALLPSWEARRTPDEVLALLKKLGIAKAAKGPPMKEVAEKPEADTPEEVDLETSPPDSGDGSASEAGDKEVLEGEVLTNHQSPFKRKFRLKATWPEGNFEGKAKVTLLADGTRRLIVELRRVI